MIIQIPCDMLALCLTRAGVDLATVTESECAELVRQYLQPMLSNHPAAIYLNVCYRRSAVPSNVFSTFAYDISIDSNGDPILGSVSPIKLPENIAWASPYHQALLTVYRILLSRGIDLCGITINIIREAGVPQYLSVRASDNHDWVGMTPDFLRQNSLPENGRPDFSRECVRKYFLNYIKELLIRYDPEGIEIDWLRAMPVVPQPLLTDFSLINEYMKTIRHTASEFGNKKLAVRVFASVDKNLQNGMDVCSWVADGSIDSLTVENFYIPTNFEIPIAEWRQKIKEKNTCNHPYQLHCGSDWAVSCGLPFCHYMTPALIRGFTTSCLERGADDVYLFNMADCNPETTMMLDENSHVLTDCFEARFAAAVNPNTGDRRYVYISGEDKRYPITIRPGESNIISIYTGKPAANYQICLCADWNCAMSVRLNGHTMSVLAEEEPLPGFSRPKAGFEIAVCYSRTQFDEFVCFFSALQLEDIQLGYNEFEITNSGSETVNISWIEVHVHP